MIVKNNARPQNLLLISYVTMDATMPEDWNNLIGSFFCKHWAKGKACTVKHCVQMGINQRLIHKAIAR